MTEGVHVCGAFVFSYLCFLDELQSLGSLVSCHLYLDGIFLLHDMFVYMFVLLRRSASVPSLQNYLLNQIKRAIVERCLPSKFTRLVCGKIQIIRL